MGLSVLIIAVATQAIFAAVAVLRPVGRMLAWLLYPGTASVSAMGNNRMDDLEFWASALFVNWLLYTLIAFGWLSANARRKAGRHIAGPPAGPAA